MSQTIPHKNRLCQWLGLAILLLAFALCLYRLGAQSLWYDETVSVYLAGESIPDLVAHTARDIHPPGYYLLLHAWSRLAGSNDFAAAFPSLFFGMLLVALAYWLGARVFGRRAGLLAAGLVAISPFHVWYSQEVRMYTLGAALGMGVLGAVLSLVESPARQPGRAWFPLAVYALCGALGLWTLYYFVFLLVAINLMVGIWWLANQRRGRVGWGWLGRWALAQVAVVLLYAPWIAVAWRQATDPPVPPWRSFTGLGDLLLQTWSALSLGQSVDAAQVWPGLLLFAALFLLGLLIRPDRSGEPALRPGPVRSRSWLLAGYVFLPVLLIYLASFVTPLYHVRYVFTYATPFYVLAGAGLAWLFRWRPVVWLSLAVVVLFAGISIYHYHTDPRYAADDHRAAVHFLAGRWRPGDAILVNAGYSYTALLTYWESAPSPGGEPIAWRGRLVGGPEADWAELVYQGPVVVQTGTVDGAPSLGWGDPRSDFYAMSRAETAAALERLFASAHRVWVYRIYDTVTDPNGFIRDWLDERGLQFEDRVFTGESQLRVQGFLAGRDALDGTGPPLDVSLADGSLLLEASTPLPSQVAAGSALDLALVWRVGAAPAADTILFAGLFDESGQRWAQTDERPLGSLYLVGGWPEGAVVRTPLRVPLPPGTPPGRYQLKVGWYRFVDGQPIWLPWSTGPLLTLGEVVVGAPADWWALPLPESVFRAGVTMGQGVQFLGFEAPLLEGEPGDTLPLDLYWQALEDSPGPGLAVLQLVDDAGSVLAEAASAPAAGRAPFVGLSPGQAVRDPRTFTLPGGLAPGVYNLSLGRRQNDGTWLPVRRGLVSLGSTYPLVTIRVTGN
jgi:4-amino-4-deoxy-L-arabinose transferase-like glycosyltransferase